MNVDPVTLTLDRRLLEHPEALHVRRMRAALWLYLVVLARLPEGEAMVEIDPAEVARRMGLLEGTIRSWLGHLRNARYLDVKRLNGSVRVTVRGRVSPKPPAPSKPARVFTAAGLARALGEREDLDGLSQVVESQSDAVIRKALAKTLAVPGEQIRRSRTALFHYLIKRYAENPDHPRP